MSFGFVRHTFVTNDRIEHVKINYFILFLTGNVRLLCPSISKIEISLQDRYQQNQRLLSLNGKLSVSDNQLFMN